LKFLNELNINHFSHLQNSQYHSAIGISMTSYLFSLLTVATHALYLMSLWSNNHHHSKSLIDPSDMLHLICGTSFLHPHPPSAIYIWTYRFNLLYTHCYHLRSLFTVSLWARSSKLTCSKNLISHLSMFPPVGLTSWL